MASQSNHQDDQPSKDSGTSSSSDANRHNDTQSVQPQPQPPAFGYPPTMGYPPGQQRNYPPPYHGYNQYHHQYPYTQPPPAAYYNAPAAYQHQQAQSSGFARGIIFAIFLVILFSCMSSIITWIVLRPEIPDFRVETLIVSNFNSSKPAFTANWEVNLTIENPNVKLKVYFDRIEGLVYYDDDDLLARSNVDPFSLDTGANMKTQARLTTNSSGANQPIVGLSVVEEMEKERKSGFVSFNYRMLIYSTFKSGSWWTRHVKMRVYCEDLKVAIDGVTGNGKLMDNKPRDCKVYA